MVMLRAEHTHNVSKLQLLCWRHQAFSLQAGHNMRRLYVLYVACNSMCYHHLHTGGLYVLTASWLNENSMGTIGLLIDFVSSMRQKLNPTLSFPPTHSKEEKPI